MSFFKKPPKKIALRKTIENENEKNESMDVDEDSNDVIKAEIMDKKKDKKEKTSIKPPKSSLLSFGDEGKWSYWISRSEPKFVSFQSHFHNKHVLFP
jgi:hypothetical protein